MGTVFQFMFFDALNPFIYEDLQAFYVFYPVFMDFRGVLQKLNSGSTLLKDKASQRRSLVKEAAIKGKARPTRYVYQGNRD